LISPASAAPIAIEAVERIDALFAIERGINGLTPQERLRVRNERSRPLVVVLETWLREQRATTMLSEIERRFEPVMV
jgi:transposase